MPVGSPHSPANTRQAALRALRHVIVPERRWVQWLLKQRASFPSTATIARALVSEESGARDDITHAAIAAYGRSRDYRILLWLLVTARKTAAMTSVLIEFTDGLVVALSDPTFWKDMRIVCPQSVGVVADEWDTRS